MILAQRVTALPHRCRRCMLGLPSESWRPERLKTGFFVATGSPFDIELLRQDVLCEPAERGHFGADGQLSGGRRAARVAQAVQRLHDLPKHLLHPANGLPAGSQAQDGAFIHRARILRRLRGSSCAAEPKTEGSCTSSFTGNTNPVVVPLM